MDIQQEHKMGGASKTIYFEPTKGRRRAQIANDAFPGVVLLIAGLSVIMNRGLIREVMPYVNIVVGAALLRYAVSEFRGTGTNERMHWFDILGGVVIIIEAISQYKPYKYFQPSYLYFLLGIVTILRGVFSEKIPKLRRVVIDEVRFFARTSPFHSLAIAWKDIVEIRNGKSEVVFVLPDRSVQLKLKRFGNRIEIANEIIESARNKGVKIAETDPAPPLVFVTK